MRDLNGKIAKKSQVIAEIIRSQDGKAVTVKFIKRGDGSERVLNGRLGVTKHLKGGELKYNPADYNLLTIFDLQKKAYRSISLDSVIDVVAGGKLYDFSK